MSILFNPSAIVIQLTFQVAHFHLLSAALIDVARGGWVMLAPRAAEWLESRAIRHRRHCSRSRHHVLSDCASCAIRTVCEIARSRAVEQSSSRAAAATIQKYLKERSRRKKKAWLSNSVSLSHADPKKDEPDGALQSGRLSRITAVDTELGEVWTPNLVRLQGSVNA